MIKINDILKPEPKSEEVIKLLKESVVDTSVEIEKPPTILLLQEDNGQYKRLLTLGNFSCISGKQKSKKTFFVCLLAGNLLREKDTDSKLINELPENKKLIIYFDTEQGFYDSWITMRRVERIAGHKKHFRGYNMRKYDPMQRCEIIEAAFKEYGKHIGLCIIDGIADLILAVNDELEATRVVSMLMRWTQEYNCHIITVLHQNKANDFIQGWIGTAISKKSEIVISVNKTKDDRSSADISCEFSRGVDFEGFRMTVDEHGLPYISDYSPEKKEKSVSSYYGSHITDITESNKIELDENGNAF